MKKMKKKNNATYLGFLCSFILLAFLIGIFHQLDYHLIRKPVLEAEKDAALSEKEKEVEVNTPKISTASVIAVGDNLYHDSLINSGKTESGPWNYDDIYQHVLDEIQAADIAMIDQETTLTDDHSMAGGYPSFATPTEVADAVVKAGFNVIESATNHVNDYGYEQMLKTLDFWKTNYPNIPVLGFYATEEDADTIHTIDVNGIKIAFLDYTYGTNNPGSIEGREYMIDIFDKEKVASAIQKAKQVSDCIIFVAHWGTEDETMPNEYQKQWAAFLMEQGVDVVIGGHPHVLQPYGRMSDKSGNEMVIFYSLGNFVSGQQKFDELLEGMASFTIEKTELNGKSDIRIVDPVVKPLVMHYNYDSNVFAPYLLEDYTNELASQHSARTMFDQEFTVENLKARFDEIMSMNVKPSTNTNLLNIYYDGGGNMIDKTTGEIVEDTESIEEWQYQQQISSQTSSQ